jgi:hypothetical protein
MWLIRSDVSVRRHDTSGPGIVFESLGLKLACLSFGMLFEISDRLAQAFRVDLLLRPFASFGAITEIVNCSMSMTAQIIP